MATEGKGPIGFAGLGTMGEPIALNLIRSGRALVVWNRSEHKARQLQSAGAEIATDPTDLFARCKTVVVMLGSGDALDAVLGRGSERFAGLVRDHLIINLGTTAPSYSQALDHALRAAGGRFVEAPVSGQKVRAENRQLVGLMAGRPEDVEEARSIVEVVCSETISFGAVPAAMAAKFALSVYQGTIMAALAEAVNYAEHRGVNMMSFAKLLKDGPLANILMKMQLPKLIDHEFSVQASVANILAVADPVIADARDLDISIPLLTKAREIYGLASEIGGADQDATFVIRAFERMSHTAEF